MMFSFTKLSETLKNGKREWVLNTVELQWLEHFWGHENMFDTGVVIANEC